MQAAAVWLGFESWFSSWQESLPSPRQMCECQNSPVYPPHSPDWHSPVSLMGQNVTHIFKQSKWSYLKIGEREALNASQATISVPQMVAAWPTGEESGCYWGIWISFYFYYIPIIKMGDLHRVKGYFTQEAHSVLVQQMFSFLQPWKNSTRRELW